MDDERKPRHWGRRILLALGALLVLAAGGLFVAAIATDYRPPEVEPLSAEGAATGTLDTGAAYRMVTYNIGYAGLGATQDFFLDGGKNSGASSLAEVEANLKGVSAYLQSANADFVLLQEVDVEAQRSFGVDQLAYLRADMPEYASFWAINYKVPFVPVPLTRPMGGVLSGIAQFSRYAPDYAERASFRGQESFPRQLFELDRCFTLSRYAVANGRDLVVINAHFSAYDKGGKVRARQLAQMQEVVEQERRADNYVILGGDFNHELPGTDAHAFPWTGEYPAWCQRIPDDYKPAGFVWAADGGAPTCRNVDKPYRAGQNFVATIDGFLVSDNIEVASVKTRETGFVHSDHQPVELVFSLKR